MKYLKYFESHSIEEIREFVNNYLIDMIDDGYRIIVTEFGTDAGTDNIIQINTNLPYFIKLFEIRGKMQDFLSTLGELYTSSYKTISFYGEIDKNTHGIVSMSIDNFLKGDNDVYFQGKKLNIKLDDFKIKLIFINQYSI